MFLIFQTILKEMVDRISTINGNIIVVKISVKIKKKTKKTMWYFYIFLTIPPPPGGTAILPEYIIVVILFYSVLIFEDEFLSNL
jgi:hypothetical protein